MNRDEARDALAMQVANTYIIEEGALVIDIARAVVDTIFTPELARVRHTLEEPTCECGQFRAALEEVYRNVAVGRVGQAIAAKALKRGVGTASGGGEEDNG